jgi:aminoglycoside phosphotransferase (APT) family kinase protein
VPTARPVPSFTSADAAATLSAACNEMGVRCDDAELMRLGENAIFRLPHERMVVRIARSIDVLADAKKEVAVASWLHDAGVPVVEPAMHRQPIVALGRPVTFWKFIEDSGTKAPIRDLGSILHELHSLPVPPGLFLPEFNIFGRVSERIAKAHDVPRSDRDFLSERLTQLRDDYANLEFALPRCAIHGDAHQSNLIVRPDKTVVLIDLERFAFGSPECDLSVTATEYLIGWHSDEEYAQFCEAYGFDLMCWDGFPVIRAINELKMTTWLMQNIREDDRIAREFAVRLASLHDEDAPRHWQPY